MSNIVRLCLPPLLSESALKKDLYDVPLCVIDINECADSTPDCDVNAECNNILGSYECMCEDGFHGNGTNCTGNLL